MRKPKMDFHAHKPVGLKDLARHLGLSTVTISTVLNGTPAAAQIPVTTQNGFFPLLKNSTTAPMLWPVRFVA